MKTWKKISGKKVHTNRFFSVYQDKVMRPDGALDVYSYITPRAGVMILPFDGQHIYLVRQFRYTTGKSLWELPAGGAENKNLLAQAKKELKEETGITAKKWTKLGNFVAAPSSSSGRGVFFLAEDLAIKKPKLEASESDMVTGKFTVAEVENMILSGKIISGWTLSCFLFFKLYRQKKI